MQKVKKIPQRQCVGCREMKEKKALLRIVRSAQGVRQGKGQRPNNDGADAVHNEDLHRHCGRFLGE